MEKKTIIAILLSALVLLSYQFYVAKHYPDAYNISGSADTEQEEPAVERQEAYEQMPQQTDITQAPATIVDLPAQEELTYIETDRHIVTLSNIGGSVKTIVLKEFPDPVTGEAYELVKAERSREAILGIVDFGGYDLSGKVFSVRKRGQEVVFTTGLGNGLTIEKRYTFGKGDYSISLSVSVLNQAAQPMQASYKLVAASNIHMASQIDRRYTQAVSRVDGKARRDASGRGKTQQVKGVVSYAGLQNKYFSMLAKPSQPAEGMRLEPVEDNNLLCSIEIPNFTINPSTARTHDYLIYAGPSKRGLMAPYGLKDAVSYGFFGGISEFLLSGLGLFKKIFRNWGIAIILLSSCVNLILFPLSRKSYESMKKMQELQPHMEKLKVEHKDNPQRLNKEMMDLYKRFNVNPMGGCLPLFLQIPIFVALYQALMRSLDLRGARFLWIKDLSMPDAVPLPFDMPLVGSSLNILPILMAVAMVLQQKVSSKKMDGESAQAKQQRQMMVIMPVVFLFIMYNFPSGLVLYWLTNTVLTMFEQRAIMRA